MANINKLLELLADNINSGQFAKNRTSDIMDLLGGSYRSMAKNKEKKFLNEYNQYTPDTSDNYKELANTLSTDGLTNPISRLLSKPDRMILDIKELITNPKWSLKNNKIGLTKDAAIIKLLTDYFNDEEENSLDEGEL